MSTVQRIMDLSDQTFAARDVLALLAYVVDMRGVSNFELQAVAKDLGLTTEADFDPTKNELDGALPGDRIILYSDALIGALGIGRERLRERFAVKAN